MSTPDDPLLKSLSDLPAVPIDEAAAEALRRRARLALVEEAAGPFSPARLSRAWSDAVLPLVLAASGAAHAWLSLVAMAKIFAG